MAKAPTPQQKSHLRELGYPEKQIRSMSFDEAKSAISEGRRVGKQRGLGSPNPGQEWDQSKKTSDLIDNLGSKPGKSTIPESRYNGPDKGRSTIPESGPKPKGRSTIPESSTKPREPGKSTIPNAGGEKGFAAPKDDAPKAEADKPKSTRKPATGIPKVKPGEKPWDRSNRRTPKAADAPRNDPGKSRIPDTSPKASDAKSLKEVIDELPKPKGKSSIPATKNETGRSSIPSSGEAKGFAVPDDEPTEKGRSRIPESGVKTEEAPTKGKSSIPESGSRAAPETPKGRSTIPDSGDLAGEKSKADKIAGFIQSVSDDVVEPENVTDAKADKIIGKFAEGKDQRSLMQKMTQFVSNLGTAELATALKVIAPLANFVGVLADAEGKIDGEEDAKIAELKKQWNEMPAEQRQAELARAVEKATAEAKPARGNMGMAEIAGRATDYLNQKAGIDRKSLWTRQQEAKAAQGNAPSEAQPEKPRIERLLTTDRPEMPPAQSAGAASATPVSMPPSQTPPQAPSAPAGAPQAAPMPMAKPQPPQAPQAAPSAPQATTGNPVNAPMPMRKPEPPMPQEPPQARPVPPQTPPSENRANPDDLGAMLALMKSQGVEGFSFKGMRFVSGDTPSGYMLEEEAPQVGGGTGGLY